MLTSPAPLDVTDGSATGPMGDLAMAFALDVSVIEQGDLGGLVQLTDDGCGSTCTACTTG
ncbi:FxLD family lanthipeptide [Micromonospora sp. WMMD980]|uniref:FxLD family lanthipeptide n=1 Tax=Micromonospora sp. WMMD980 TaxID=3016088 RepID=UPI002415FDA5|nr:FxLD family lanthipeptide [Micromonospora sp. WMMD980]MDG4803702.1 FxLD family lanthipeptide [Micromonospora sp. WMMD980]